MKKRAILGAESPRRLQSQTTPEVAPDSGKRVSEGVPGTDLIRVIIALQYITMSSSLLLFPLPFPSPLALAQLLLSLLAGLDELVLVSSLFAGQSYILTL